MLRSSNFTRKLSLGLALVLALAAPHGQAQVHLGSSPFAPPKADDVTFVVDQDRGLDSGCTFRSGGPLTFTIRVTRFIGEVNNDGTLKDLATLIGNQVVSATATLTMPGFDVDYDAIVAPYNPERDQVLFNGHPVEFLKGLNNEWVMNSFVIPIELVKFPARGANGQAPTPAENIITVNIDTANADELWCTAIDWSALSIKALSPLVLVHGNNSDGAFFERQGFVGWLRTHGIPYDNSISMSTAPVAGNSGVLDTLLPAIVASFGVDSIHLVAHSKGGLDSRDYLANYQGAHDAEFKILSLTTLSTPHNGSVLADVKLGYDAAARVTSHISFSGFPGFTESVAAASVADAGLPNLSVAYVASFNPGNLARLPATTKFNTVAADADTNGNGEIDLTPDEYLDLRRESAELMALHNSTFGNFKSRKAVDAVYQVLRTVANANVSYTPVTLFGRTLYTTATIAAVPTVARLGNDTLVTIPSGQGDGSLAPRVNQTHIFNGSDGLNHSNVANAGVAATVIPWLIDVERSDGDLR
jgi:triacylglycerol lipase